MDYPISVPGVGLVGGKFTDGDPLLSQQASLDPAAWANAVTDELLNVIIAAGLTPNEAQTDQLLQAIQKFAAQDYKNSARVVVTTAIALSGLPTVEGVPLVAGDRVLRALPAADVLNGLYVVAAGAWTRAVDADTSIEVTDSLLVAVEQGSTNKDTLWQLVTDAPIVLGTTALLFEQVAGPTGVTAGFYSGVTVDKRGRVVGGTQGGEIKSIAAAVAANALTLTLNPTVLDFRSATLGSGAVNARTISAALSLVVPSGATLGAVNAVASRLALLAIDNAGTVELAVCNLVGGLNLDETTLINTTAISGASNAANVIYSTTARTGVPFRVVGLVDSTQATAGTWATAPSEIQGMGGAATNAIDDRRKCTAWVNFNGAGTVAIRDSYNVSSITDNGVGNWTVNFATALANANYTAIPGIKTATVVPSGSTHLYTADITARTTAGLTLRAIDWTPSANNAAAYDTDTIDVQIFGGKA